MMSLGAKGVVSVAANLVPEVMVQMSHLCLEGRFREAAALQIEYTDLIDALFLEVNPIPIKTALNLAGYEVGFPAPPPLRHVRRAPGDPAPRHGERSAAPIAQRKDVNYGSTAPLRL